MDNDEGLTNLGYDPDGDNLASKKPTNKRSALILSGLQYTVDETPPFFSTILLALQHYLMLLSSNLATPAIIASTVCTDDPGVKAIFLGDLMFVCGVCTVIQTFIGIRLPIVQCPAFAYIAPMLTLTKVGKYKCDNGDDSNTVLLSGNLTTTEAHVTNGTPDYVERINTLIGSIMAAGALEIVIGASGLISVLLRFIGPLTIAPTIMLMAIPAAGTGFDLSGKHWGISIGTMGLILIFSEMIPIFYVSNPCKSDGERRVQFVAHKMLSVIASVSLMWLLCYILTVTDVLPSDETEYGYEARTDTRLHIIDDASWFRFPYPGHWGTPKFSLSIFIAMVAGVISSIIESIGDYYTCARLAGALPPPAHAINRGILIEGMDCIISSVCGVGYGMTSCTQNIGIIDLTKVGSRMVVLVAGIFMAVLGCFGKFTSVIAALPDPITGGSFMVLFVHNDTSVCRGGGMVYIEKGESGHHSACSCLMGYIAVLTAVGASSLQYVNLNSSRNLAVFGMALFLGLGFPPWVVANEELIVTGSEDFDQVLKALVSNNMFVGSFTALFLDNILPGTPEERGINVWAEISQDASNYDNDDDDGTGMTLKTYDFPFGMGYLRRKQWPKYIPFMPGFEGFPCLRRCTKGRAKEYEVKHNPALPMEKQSY